MEIVMKLRNIAGICLLPALLVVFLIGRNRWSRSTPNEWGIHNLVVEAQSDSSARGPHIGNCPVFPKDNVWNTPVDKLPVAAKSDDYISSIGADIKLHPDFASALKWGIPYGEVPRGTRSVPVTFGYRDDSDPGNYPIPPDPPIEGGPGAKTGDLHLILIDPIRCLLYELWAVRKSADGGWQAGSGVKMDLTRNALRPLGLTSADAAGLAIFPGLVRYDEVQSGEINHALRFTARHTQAAFVWPARHEASRDKNPDTPPMGIRLRLKANFDTSGFSKQDQVILRALKRYGMILADNGGPLFLSGVSDKRWDDDDLHKIGAVTGKDFEVVDESGLQLLRDDGRVDPTAIHR
jgi:hypothetical protein